MVRNLSHLLGKLEGAGLANVNSRIQSVKLLTEQMEKLAK